MKLRRRATSANSPKHPARHTKGPRAPLKPVAASSFPPGPWGLRANGRRRGDRVLRVSFRPEDELGIGSPVVPPAIAFADPAELDQPRAPLPSSASREQLESHIFELESRLDQLIEDSSATAHSERRPSRHLQGQGPEETPPDPKPQPPLFAHAALSHNPYFAEQWGPRSLEQRLEETDDFGYDPAFEAKAARFLDFLVKRYFRVKVRGLEHLPARGRGVLVANHSGTFPFDGLILRAAISRLHSHHRAVRWLTEDFVHYLPFAGVFFNRMGAVRACQENAERLLGQDELVAVFPEGLKGLRKLYKKRYTLERFGRGGYVRLALRTRSPLIPCAIIGAEESNPMLERLDYLPRLFGLPYLPITPTFPWLGLLGFWPAPTRWTVLVGEPFDLSSYGPEASFDPVLVGRLSDRVQRSIEELISEGLRARKSVWFG